MTGNTESQNIGIWMSLVAMTGLQMLANEGVNARVYMVSWLAEAGQDVITLPQQQKLTTKRAQTLALPLVWWG